MLPFVFDFILAGGIFLATTLLYLLLLAAEKHRLRLFYKKKIEKTGIINELADVAVRAKVLIEKNGKCVVSEYPNTIYYISQASQLIKRQGFNIDGIVIKSIFDISNDIPGFNKKGFMQEISKLAEKKRRRKESEKKKELLDLILQTSGLFGRIYKLHHPLQYRIEKIKKSVLLRILDILIKFMNRLKKSEEENNERFLRPRNEAFSLKSITERKEQLNETALIAALPA